MWGCLYICTDIHRARPMSLFHQLSGWLLPKRVKMRLTKNALNTTFVRNFHCRC